MTDRRTPIIIFTAILVFLASICILQSIFYPNVTQTGNTATLPAATSTEENGVLDNDDATLPDSLPRKGVEDEAAIAAGETLPENGGEEVGYPPTFENDDREETRENGFPGSGNNGPGEGQPGANAEEDSPELESGKGRLVVTVVEAMTGKPITNARVYEASRTGLFSSIEFDADSAGKHTLDVEPGVCRITVYKSGYKNYYGNRLRIRAGEVKKFRIELEPEEEKEEIEEPPLDAFIEGFVSDAKTKLPIVGARISWCVRRGSVNMKGETTTDSSGRYRASVPSGGEVSIRFSAYDYVSKEPPYVELGLGQVYRLDVDLFTCDYIDYLRTLCAVGGTVVDARSGLPIPGATVTCSDERTECYRSVKAKTDIEGRFTLSVAPGSCSVWVRCADCIGSSYEEEFEVAEGETKELIIHLTLRVAASLSGTVVDSQTGAALGKVQVELHPYAEDEDKKTTLTDDAGRFEFETTEGATGLSYRSKVTRGRKRPFPFRLGSAAM